MEYVKLGNTNLKVGRLSLGGLCFGDPIWRPYVLAEDDSRTIIRRALDYGFNLIDTSNYYSLGRSEEIIGRALKDFVPRDEIVIATKVGNPMGTGPNAGGFSRKHLFSAIDESLRRLDTDYIDIYQTHIWHKGTDLEEMIVAFDDLVRAGKILYPGITIMPIWQFVSCVVMARNKGLTAFATVSNQYNLIWREDERELLPFCRSEGIGVLAHSPLARGLLCGRARRTEGTRTVRSTTDEYAEQCYHRNEDIALADLIDDLAKERGVKPAQLALSWVLSRPDVHSVIVGPTRPEHIDDAVEALSIELVDEDRERLEGAYRYRPVECS